ncbi:DUF6522 family protein [Aliihoeflea sp. PC F10.4]
MTGGELVLSDASGDFTLDAALVAQGFGWSQHELQNHMRRGHVISRVERGEGEDEGRWRLSLRCGNRLWRAVVTQDCVMIEHEVAFTHHPA